jgi:putative transposase
MNELHFFDPRADVLVIERRLPHWAQAGTVSFVTWRTNDSLPRVVVEKWRSDRLQWLRQHGINPESATWREQLAHLGPRLQQWFFTHFSTRWHDELDACQGACVLRNPLNAQIVADSLMHDDGGAYEISDFIVMPNHVHLLATFLNEDAMLKQCQSWKHFSARRINRRMGTKGRFWQQDGFDHLVRSEEQFEHFRRYIAANPSMAQLDQGQYLHWRRPNSHHGGA